jgi:hypothetical protein
MWKAEPVELGIARVDRNEVTFVTIGDTRFMQTYREWSR